MITSRPETFSANVELNLYVGGRKLPVGHLGPDFGLLDQPAQLEATEAELETIVDGRVSRWPIRLINSQTSDGRKFTFESPHSADR